MYIKSVLVVVCVIVLHFEVSAALYLKRAEFDDPRLFSSAFGKRSPASSVEQEKQQPDNGKYYAIKLQRRDDMDDPRFMSMAFGKRSIIPTLDDFHRYAIYDKRGGADLDDPRFFSGAFGRK